MSDKAQADAEREARRDMKRRKAELRAGKEAHAGRKEKGLLSKNRLRDDFLSQGIVPELPDFDMAIARFRALRRKMPPDAPLDAFDFKVNSQHGEDGILLEIFSRLGRRGGTAVEIAAGHNGGNSPAIVGCLGFRALWVEADPVYSKILEKSFAGYPVIVSDGFVTIDNVRGLLTEHGFAEDLDYLGIDIDGNDFWIWWALAPLRPRVIVAEYNPSFGPSAAVTIAYQPSFDRKAPGPDGDKWAHSKGYFGASLVALQRFGAREGYRLVCTSKTGNNAFFLREDVLPDVPAISSEVAYRRPVKPNMLRILEHQEEIGFDAWLAQLKGPLVMIAPDGTPSSLPSSGDEDQEPRDPR